MLSVVTVRVILSVATVVVGASVLTSIPVVLLRRAAVRIMALGACGVLLQLFTKLGEGSGVLVHAFYQG